MILVTPSFDTYNFQNSETTKFSLFKPLSLWQFVMASLRHIQKNFLSLFLFWGGKEHEWQLSYSPEDSKPEDQGVRKEENQ